MKAILVDFSILVRVIVPDNTEELEVIQRAAEKLKKEYPVSDISECCISCTSDLEVPYDPSHDKETNP